MATNRENVNIAALEQLINNIDNFNERMVDLVMSMMSSVNEIQNNWNDDQYNEFRDFMCDSIKSLRADLSVMEETQESLEEVYRKLTIR